MARKYIHEKTHKVRVSNLEPHQVLKYGYILYEEPNVKKQVRVTTGEKTEEVRVEPDNTTQAASKTATKRSGTKKTKRKID